MTVECIGHGIYRDIRLGGVPRLSIGPPRDAAMRVPDEVLKSVAFLCIRTIEDGVEKYRYCGTGFFVAVPSIVNPERNFIYFVTARHNVQKAAQLGELLYVRVNTHSGDSQHLQINVEWIYPEKDGVDLAMIKWAPSSTIYDYRTVGTSVFTTPEIFITEGIGVGDELFCVGLFTYRHGAKKNYPIVRSGVIAAMPNEPFEDPNTAFKYDAYLAEVRSIGGLSGSPVFVCFPDLTHPSTIRRARNKLFYSFGVIRGHWDLKKKESSINFDDGELRDVNMGMAIVTPISELSVMLDSIEEQQARQNAEIKFAQQNAPVED